MDLMDSSVERILKAFDLSVKRMLSMKGLDSRFIILGSVMICVWLAVMVFMNIYDPNNIFLQLIGMITGFAGLTVIFAFQVILSYRICEHVKLAGYYISYARDIISLASKDVLQEYDEFLEEAYLYKCPHTEYSPLALILGYLAILSMYVYIAPLFYAGYLAILGIFAYTLYDAVMEHQEIERKVNRLLLKLIGMDDETMSFHEPPEFKPIYVLTTVFTLGLHLFVWLSGINSYLDVHIVDHRRMYELFKKRYVSMYLRRS